MFILKLFSTKSLAKELAKRPGILRGTAGPNEKYKGNCETSVFSGTGPAVILVVNC